jgi:hypothetical protein
MSALYAMRYLGQAGVGVGAIFVGKGKIVGIDVGGGRYDGSYTEQGGRLKGTGTMTFPTGGTLVTGQQAPQGTKIPLTVDWPSNFADGSAHPLTVQGRAVQVTFEKIGDVP